MALPSRYFLATAEGQTAAGAYALPSGTRMQAVPIEYARTAKRGPGAPPGNWWTSGDGQPNPCIVRLQIDFQAGSEKLAATTATAMIDAAQACVALIRVDGQGNTNVVGSFVIGTHVLAREIRMPILGLQSSNRNLLVDGVNRVAYEIALLAGHDRWNVAHDYSGVWTEF